MTPSTKEEPMKPIVTALCIGLVLTITGVLALQPWQGVVAEGEHTISIRVYTLTSGGANGDQCFPWGLVDQTLEELPFRQMIVTNHQGEIVGVMDLEVGHFDTFDNDQQSCSIEADIQIEDAPFYTFTVEGKYRRTVSREVLAHEMIWQLFAHVLP